MERARRKSQRAHRLTTQMIQERMGIRVGTGILPAAERPKVMQETVQSDKNQLQSNSPSQSDAGDSESGEEKEAGLRRPRVFQARKETGQ